MANAKFKIDENVRIKTQGGVGPIPVKDIRGKCGIIVGCAGTTSTPLVEECPEYTHFAYWVKVEGKQAHRIIEEWLEPCK